ncbi:hypothetical protein VPH35_077466 [Triticum aestivum]
MISCCSLLARDVSRLRTGSGRGPHGRRNHGALPVSNLWRWLPHPGLRLRLRGCGRQSNLFLWTPRQLLLRGSLNSTDAAADATVMRHEVIRGSRLLKREGSRLGVGRDVEPAQDALLLAVMEEGVLVESAAVVLVHEPLRLAALPLVRVPKFLVVSDRLVGAVLHLRLVTRDPLAGAGGALHPEARPCFLADAGGEEEPVVGVGKAGPHGGEILWLGLVNLRFMDDDSGGVRQRLVEEPWHEVPSNGLLARRVEAHPEA